MATKKQSGPADGNQDQGRNDPGAQDGHNDYRPGAGYDNDQPDDERRYSRGGYEGREQYQSRDAYDRHVPEEDKGRGPPGDSRRQAQAASEAARLGRRHRDQQDPDAPP